MYFCSVSLSVRVCKLDVNFCTAVYLGRLYNRTCWQRWKSIRKCIATLQHPSTHTVFQNSILSWLFHIQAVISKSVTYPHPCTWISMSNDRVYFDGITGFQRFLQSDKITVRKILCSSFWNLHLYNKFIFIFFFILFYFLIF